MMCKLLLMIAAGACILLFLAGCFYAGILGMLGLTVLVMAPLEGLWDLFFYDLLCLLTVALPSLCCTKGLYYLFRLCIDNLKAPRVSADPHLVALSLLSLAVTFLMIRLPGEVGPAGIVWLVADVILLAIIILYFIHQKRGASHDPHRP